MRIGHTHALLTLRPATASAARLLLGLLAAFALLIVVSAAHSADGKQPAVDPPVELPDGDNADDGDNAEGDEAGGDEAGDELLESGPPAIAGWPESAAIVAVVLASGVAAPVVDEGDDATDGNPDGDDDGRAAPVDPNAAVRVTWGRHPGAGSMRVYPGLVLTEDDRLRLPAGGWVMMVVTALGIDGIVVVHGSTEVDLRRLIGGLRAEQESAPTRTPVSRRLIDGLLEACHTVYASLPRGSARTDDPSGRVDNNEDGPEEAATTALALLAPSALTFTARPVIAWAPAPEPPARYRITLASDHPAAETNSDDGSDNGSDDGSDDGGSDDGEPAAVGGADAVDDKPLVVTVNADATASSIAWPTERGPLRANETVTVTVEALAEDGATTAASHGFAYLPIDPRAVQAALEWRQAIAAAAEHLPAGVSDSAIAALADVATAMLAVHERGWGEAAWRLAAYLGALGAGDQATRELLELIARARLACSRSALAAMLAEAPLHAEVPTVASDDADDSTDPADSTDSSTNGSTDED